SGLLGGCGLRVLIGDHLLSDLVERDRQRLVAQAAGLHERRHELSAALAELVVVGVDLSRALRGQHHEGVLGVHSVQQVVELRLIDHVGSPSRGRGSRRAWMIAATCSTAWSRSSLTTRWSNQPSSASSAAAPANRRLTESGSSVPRSSRRRSSSSRLGGWTKI